MLKNFLEKMKQLKYIFTLALVALTAVSCLTGKGYEPYKTDNGPVETGLKIVADKSVIYATGEDVATFKATYNGIALTADQVTFHYAGTNDPVTDMDGFLFATTSAGRHEIYARYAPAAAAPAAEQTEEGEGEGETTDPEAYISNSFVVTAVMMVNLEDEEDRNPAENDLTLSASTLVCQAGSEDRVYFVVRYNGEVVCDPTQPQTFKSGETLTVEYKICDYNTQQPVEMSYDEIKQNGKSYKIPYFSAQESGSYSFFVMWKALMTYESPVTITSVGVPVPLRPNDAQPDNTDFKRRVLLLQLTGTSCPNCPYMSVAIRELMAEGSGYEDKFAFAASHTYKDHPFNPDKNLGVYAGQGYPTACLDLRYSFVNMGKENNKTQITRYIDNRLANPAKAGISANMALNDNALVVRMTVKAAETGNYRVGAWLVEDNLFYVQSNSSSFDNEEYGLNNHEGVIRIVNSARSSADFTGYDLDKYAELQAGDVADYLFTFELDPEWKKEDCRLVLFVTAMEDNSGFVVNNAVATNSIYEAVEFEYN